MNEAEMNAVEYYRSLIGINHPFLLQKTIEENSEVFPINKVEDISNMNEIIYKVILILKAYNGDVEGVKDMLNMKHLPMETFDFISVLKEEETIEEFYQDQASMMNEAEMFYFKILADSTKKEIKLCEFQLITNIDVNKYFGNYKLGNFDHLRNETAISNKTSIVLAINKRLYSTCIQNDKRNNRDKEIDNIYLNSFFHLMRRHIFVKNCFYSLDLIELSKNTIIYAEQDPIDYIYIVKSGTFEISLPSKSIDDLKVSINHIKSLHSDFREFDDTFPLNNPSGTLSKLMHMKRNLFLFVTENDVFGLWEYYYKTNAIYNIRVVSDKAMMYRISIETLEKDNEDYALLMRGIKGEAKKKGKSVLKRMIEVEKAVMRKIDAEITIKKKEEESKKEWNETESKVKGKNEMRRSVVNINKESLKKLNENIKRSNKYNNMVKGIKQRFVCNNNNLNPLINETKKSSTSRTLMKLNNSTNRTITEDNEISKSCKLNVTKVLKQVNSKFMYNHQVMNTFGNEEIVLPKIFPHKKKMKSKFIKVKKYIDDTSRYIDNNSIEKSINYHAVKQFYRELKPYMKKF